MIQVDLWQVIAAYFSGAASVIASLWALRTKLNAARKEEWTLFFAAHEAAMEKAILQESRHEQRHQSHERGLSEFRDWRSGFERSIDEKFEQMKEQMTGISTDVREIRTAILPHNIQR